MRKSLLSSSILLLSPLTALALGLGDIKVNSSLNEPLDARIELQSASFRDLESLIVKMASTQEFLKGDVEKSDILRSVRFKVKEDADGTSYIQVYTKKILREPFIDLLIDVSWGAGRLLREYTILLDPPEIAKVIPKAIVKPVVPKLTAMSEEVKKVVGVTTGIETSQISQADVGTDTPDTSSSTGEIISARTTDSDTLWSVANNMRPDSSISIEQMMLAILRDNPKAFNRGNINGLMGGFVLRIGEPSTITELTKQQAQQEVAEQNRVWKEIRLKAGYPISPSVKSDDKVKLQQQAEKTVTPKPEIEKVSEDIADSTAPEQVSEAQLELLTSDKVEKKAQAAAESSEEDALSDKLAAQLALTEELMESQIQENEELKARIRELERLLNKKESLVELKDENLAILQQKQQQEMAQEQAVSEPEMVESQLATEQAVEPQITEEMATEPLPELDSTEPMSTPEAMAQEPILVSPQTELELEEHIDDISLGEERSQADEIRVQEEDAEEVSDDKTESEAAELKQPTPKISEPEIETKPVEESQKVSKVEPKPEMAKATPQPKKVTPKAIPAKIKQPEPDLLTNIMNNYLMEAGAAGGVLLLLILLLLLRKSKGKQEDDFQESILNARSSDGAIAEQEEPIEPAQESTGLEDETTFLSDFSSSELDSLQPDDTESDPLSEADVFIVYGRYGQAEELLNGVIKTSPQRLDYQMKLLEVYHGDKQKQSFKQQAETVKGLIEGSGEDISLSSDWEKVQGMASALDINLSTLESSEGSQLSQITDSIGDDDDDDEFDLDSIDVDELERQLMASEAMLNDDYSFDSLDEEVATGQDDELGIDKIAAADDTLLNEDLSALDDSTLDQGGGSFELDLDDLGTDISEEPEVSGADTDTTSKPDEIMEDIGAIKDAEIEQAMDINLDDLELDDSSDANVELSLDDAVSELSLEDELQEGSAEPSSVSSADTVAQEPLSDSSLDEFESDLSLDDEFASAADVNAGDLEMDLDDLGGDELESIAGSEDIDGSEVNAEQVDDKIAELDLDDFDSIAAEQAGIDSDSEGSQSEETDLGSELELDLDDLGVPEQLPEGKDASDSELSQDEPLAPEPADELELDLDDLSLEEDRSEQATDVSLESESEALQKMVSDEIGSADDFELDLDDLSLDEPSEPISKAEQVSEAPNQQNTDDLELDLDDLSLEESGDEAVESIPPVEQKSEVKKQEDADDFELDLDDLSLEEPESEGDATDHGADISPEQEQQSPADDLELDLDDIKLDDTQGSKTDDISLADELEQIATQEDHIEDIDLDSLSLDENTEVLNADLESLAESDELIEPNLDELDADLNEFAELDEQEGDIDLAEIEAELSKIMDDEPEGKDDDLGELSLEDMELVPDEEITELDSIGNKLDLAKAYIEKGDKEAAIELLSTVMETGDEEQKQQAKKLFELAK